MNLVEDVVVINHKPYCLRHKVNVCGVYNEKYDCYYCPACNRWIEPECKCGGDCCDYFPKRPEKPIEDPGKKYDEAEYAVNLKRERETFK